MKFPLALLACLTLLAAAATRGAQPEPAMVADDLQQLCTGTDHVSRNACRIYILGVTQGLSLGMKIAAGREHIAAACVPAETSAEQLEDAVKARLEKDLAAKPAERTLDASTFVARVLGSEFPCAKQAAH
jgi:hypothetical protein